MIMLNFFIPWPRAVETITLLYLYLKSMVEEYVSALYAHNRNSIYDTIIRKIVASSIATIGVGKFCYNIILKYYRNGIKFNEMS